MKNYSLGMYEKALEDSRPLEEKLELASKLGYDHIEFCVDLNEERAKRIYWSKSERYHYRNAAQNCGIPFTTFSLSLLRKYPLGVLDKSTNEKSFEILERGCELAVDMGSRLMLVNGYDVYGEPSTKETRERFFENLPKAVNICSQYGVILAIENAEMPFCSSIADGMEIIKHFPSPFLQIYGDVGNITNTFNGDSKKSVEDLKCGRGHITSLHLKDSLPGEYRFGDYGKGHVDFKNMVKAAKEMGIALYTAEIFCDERKDPIENARFVANFLKQFLDN